MDFHIGTTGCFLYIFFTLNGLSISLPTENVQTSPSKVLIIGQMRSGSSFLGELFNQHPNSFYMFEPLRAVARESSNDTNSIIRAIKGYPYVDDNIPGIMKNLLNCDFSKLSLNILKDDFMLRTQHGANFYSCIKGPLSSKLFNECLADLTKSCSSKNVRVAKTIRMDLTVAEKVMTSIEDLKIIYLVRDPRAIIQSRISLGLVDNQNVAEESSALCNRIKGDIKQIEHFQYTTRIKIVKYEDIAKNTVSIAKDIYKFISSSFHPKVLHWIKRNSMTFIDPHPFSTSKNSEKSANKWISEISTEVADIIDKSCSHLYEYFEYRLFTEIKTKL